MKQEVTVIQKGVNAIKTIFFLSLHISVFSQSDLKGEYNYCDGVVDNGTCQVYTFKKNGVFKLNTLGELGKINHGKGNYFIKNDSLILSYNLTELKEESFHKLKKYYNSKDSILVELKISDFNKKLLSNISVIGDLESRYGVLSDYEGKAFLKFKKEKGIKKISISDLCCGNYSFYVNTEFNSKIDIYLSKGFRKPKLIKNEINKYKIIEITKKYIKLKDRKKEFSLMKQ